MTGQKDLRNRILPGFRGKGYIKRPASDSQAIINTTHSLQLHFSFIIHQLQLQTTSSHIMSCPVAEATVKSVWEGCNAALEAQDLDKAMTYYHPDCVVVHRGTAGYYGQDNIKQLYAGFFEAMGKGKTEFANATYVGCGDWIIVKGEYVTTTEKLGEMKGKLLQVWRKDTGAWLIYHDEFDA